jgi:hypothetical protein
MLLARFGQDGVGIPTSSRLYESITSCHSSSLLLAYITWQTSTVKIRTVKHTWPVPLRSCWTVVYWGVGMHFEAQSAVRYWFLCCLVLPMLQRFGGV